MYDWSKFFSLPPEKLIFYLLLLAIPILPNLWCIWNAFHREFRTVNEKLAWIGIGVFVPVLGGLAYLFIGRRRSRPMVLPNREV